MKQARSALVPLSLLLLASAAAAAPQRAPGTARDWEHETSDLEADPRIRFGELPNGLRWGWMANGEPRERSYLRLHVDVGSLAEDDAERGMAHFLEHMAFNGSERFAPGTLVEWFQEHGMEFGADLNAFTSFSETIYVLDLAHSDEETLTEGLAVLRDWADGLLLEPEEVEAEKGVIDGEDAESRSAGRRVQERILAEQFGGTRYPSRLPIGVQAAREAFDAEAVRAFYERWYRPENMTLVLVGDLGELDPTPLFVAAFGDLAAPDRPVEPEPAIGSPEPVERSFVVHEPELPSVAIHVERLKPYDDEPDTKGTRTEDLDLECARSMLNLRFAELAKAEGAPFLSAGVDELDGLEVYDGQELVVTAEPAKWRAALAAAELELRRALEFGFQPAELHEVRANWLRNLDEAVERERTRHSASFAGELAHAAEERHVPTPAAVERALQRPVIEALTVEQCHAALVEAWSEGVPNLFAVGGLDLGEEGGAVLAAAWEEAREREVERGAEAVRAEFAYASDPERTGEIASKRHVEDLDVWLVTFANGVRLNVKSTDFKDRQVIVGARLAEGLLTLPPEEYAVGWVGTQAVNLAGLGEHTADDLRRLTAGRNVGVGFGWSNDAFSLGGATTADDLVLELELLAAQLADPGWRDDGVRMMRDRAPLLFERLEHVASGPLVLEFLPALFHGDARFAELPAREGIEGVSMDDVRAWLAPHLADGPLEVTIVGDVEVEAAVAAAARTLGVLPPRREREPFAERREVAPPETGLRMTRAIETSDDKSFVFLVFPVGDGLETERRRAIRFLAEVVQDRLRLEVRERLGAAYSPSASATPSTVFPGVGLLTIQSNVTPSKVDEFVSACLAVARSLSEEGVTEEEVKRLAEPVLARIRDDRRTNPYWIGALEEAQSRPSTLEDVRTLEAYYRDLSAERIGELAKQSLDPERASILIVNPSAAKADKEAREAAAEEDEEPR